MPRATPVAGKYRPVRYAMAKPFNGYAFMDWLIYIVECCDGSLYTGITNDLQKRINSHNAGTGAKYTAVRRPVRLVYRENATSRSSASKREISIKRLTRKAKQELYLKP